MKKKLLYITDQEEYSEHGTISSLFHGYLKEYLEVHVVYFTKYKHSFQIKGDDFIVPDHYASEVIEYLERKDIPIASYDFVFVRNIKKVLKNVLDNKSKYGYKVGFRSSFAKSSQAYRREKIKPSGFLKSLRVMYGNFTKDRLINKVDLFMPTSYQMKSIFYPNIAAKTFRLMNALDPKTVSVRQKRDDGKRRFIYVGTLDELREFEVVLDAFNALRHDNWELAMAVYDPTVIRGLLKLYPKIRDRVEITHADELSEIKKRVCGCDVGLALLPDIDLYNNAIAAKVLDYYSCAVPALLSQTKKNASVFTDGEDAFICEFEAKIITQKLESIFDLSEEELIEMGKKGQQRLLADGRDYKKMAKELYEVLETL